MNFKCCCLLFVSLLLVLLGVAIARPSTTPQTTTELPPCTPWCAGQPTPPPGYVN